MRQLTNKELEWAKRNPEAVRAAMQAVGITPEQEAREDIVKAAELAGNAIRKKLGEILSKRQREVDSVDRSRRMIANEADGKYRKSLETDIDLKEELIALMSKHAKALQAKLESLENAPERCFLPFGTVVRFVGVPDYVDSLGLIDDRDQYPAAGMVGVVTRVGTHREYFMGVSMRRDFRTRDGSEWHPEYDRTITFFVDPDMIEVIEFAKLPNGEDYKGYGFVETHEREDDDKPLEMVLEADGFFWRFHDFGGMTGIEALQAFESMDEMSWIAGPHPRYAVDRGSSGPNP